MAAATVDAGSTLWLPHVATNENNMGFMANPSMNQPAGGFEVENLTNHLVQFGNSLSEAPRQLPATSLAPNPRDLLYGRALMAQDANNQMGVVQVKPGDLSSWRYDGLELLGNAFSKDTPYLNAQNYPGIKNLPTGFFNQGSSVGAENSDTRLARTMNIAGFMYCEHKLFMNLTLTACIRAQFFIFGEFLQKHGRHGDLICVKNDKHVRDVGIMNFALGKYLTMPYGRWRVSNPRGGARAIWPRTANEYNSARPDRFTPSLEFSDWVNDGLTPAPTGDDFQFSPWDLLGYINDHPGVAENVMAINVAGLFRRAPNIWNMCINKPVPGSKLYLYYALRVVGDEGDKQNLMEHLGGTYPIQDDTMVRPMIIPYVGEGTKEIPLHLVETAHCRGHFFYIGRCRRVYQPYDMHKYADRARSALFPTQSGFYESGDGLGSCDVVDIFVDGM